MFNPGDKVIIRNDSFYSVSKKGSWGYVMERPCDYVGYVWVDFKEVTGDTHSSSRKFIIRGSDLELFEEISQETAVIRKIKQMDEKRKSLGYRW